MQVSVTKLRAEEFPASGGDLLVARDIGKSFAGIRALMGVDLSIRAGEVLALVGENGAGKSTLMNILAGIIPHGRHEGTLTMNGTTCAFKSPYDAEDAGINLVAQELRIATVLPIAENMFMGHLPRGKLGLVDFSRMLADSRKWLQLFDMDCDPALPAGRFSTAEQRMMMIAGALSREARILLLDEPTAALTAAETDRLFAHVARLKDRGLGIVFITHRLDEVEQIADRVIVMRNGRVAHQLDNPVGHRTEIVHHMIGRDILPTDRAKAATGKIPAETVLTVNDLTLEDPNVAGKLIVNGLNLTLRKGEIHGLYGLVGAGRTEFARAVFGDWPGPVRGTIDVLGRSVRPLSPQEAIAMGIAFLTEDRKATGIMPGHSISTNLSAASLQGVSRLGVVNAGAETSRNREMMQRLDVRPEDPAYLIENLSGGNQQKVLFGRWLNTNPTIILLDEPTLGVDVGARRHLYDAIGHMAEAGLAVLLISSDVDEVLLECDRISVMYKGAVVREFGAERSRHELIAAATGGDNA